MNRVPTVDEYVAAFLQMMEAPTKQKTVFAGGLKQRVRSAGEKTIFAPDGTPLKIVSDPSGVTHVEHGDHQHAHVRPRPVTASFFK